LRIQLAVSGFVSKTSGLTSRKESCRSRFLEKITRVCVLAVTNNIILILEPWPVPEKYDPENLPFLSHWVLPPLLFLDYIGHRRLMLPALQIPELPTLLQNTLDAGKSNFLSSFNCFKSLVGAVVDSMEMNQGFVCSRHQRRKNVQDLVLLVSSVWRLNLWAGTA